MLSVGNAALGSSSPLSLDTRAAAGALAANANVATSSADTTTTSAAAVTLSDRRVPTYNAIEFIYRSDFGKIILREQNAETGQEITQVPSEYHLQQYAATQRAQRIQLQTKLFNAEPANTQPRSGTGTGSKSFGSGGTTGKAGVATTGSGQGAPAATTAPAPAPQPAAPAAPVVAVAAPAAHVDIKV